MIEYWRYSLTGADGFKKDVTCEEVKRGNKRSQERMRVEEREREREERGEREGEKEKERGREGGRERGREREGRERKRERRERGGERERERENEGRERALMSESGMGGSEPIYGCKLVKPSPHQLSPSRGHSRYDRANYPVAPQRKLAINVL